MIQAKIESLLNAIWVLKIIKLIFFLKKLIEFILHRQLFMLLH